MPVAAARLRAISLEYNSTEDPSGKALTDSGNMKGTKFGKPNQTEVVYR